MAKKKNFRDLVDEVEYHPTKKDSKRYDKKKARIQSARKNKRKLKNSLLDY
jgi:hypothetical protein